jgi:hypothetical protein
MGDRQTRIQMDGRVGDMKRVQRAVLIRESHCEKGMSNRRLRERSYHLTECLFGRLRLVVGEQDCTLLQSRVGRVGPALLKFPLESGLKAHVGAPPRALNVP